MKIANAPSKFPVVWASGAGAGFVRTVPVASQIGVTPGAASFTDGFPPLNFLDPQSAGGVPPFGEDMNGILKALSAGMQGLNAGMLPTFDATFCAAIGGYPNGAALVSADGTHFWRSTVDDNGSNPDTGGSNWVVLQTSPTSYPWASITGVPAFMLTSGFSAALLAAFNGSNQLVSANGYQMFPGGRIEQECSVSVPSAANTTINVTYPIAFPTLSKIPTLTIVDPTVAVGTSAMMELEVISYSLTGCVVAIGQQGGSSRNATLGVKVVGY